MKNFSDIPDPVSGKSISPNTVEKMGLSWLIIAAITTVVLWQFPWGNYILYPFTILATWFHEMGHGLAAIILGGNFQKLVLYQNGSGLAQHSGKLFLGPIGRALVAAAGLMGPPIAGALFIIASRKFRHAHYSLIFLGGILLLSVFLWVRSLFGIIAISLLGITILIIALKSPKWLQGFAIQFLGTQACISTFHQLDYLFTHSVTIGGRNMLSDTGQIAEQLLLPYWFWGSLIAATSFLLLVQSLRIAYRQ
ncbi:peptidase M50 [Planktothricoides sp. SR001]|uniref:M50 family metallopeptidase n=1 Tax=Planktothricoides sp. SR001 TaxID=1705388 RepID=UPI0006C399D3|nr:M50 family metallopeptidase [Planktothricoides sp. SR001]KOR34213.1 peptidase M50 [Planktothricoides sp. SR001]